MGNLISQGFFIGDNQVGKWDEKWQQHIDHTGYPQPEDIHAKEMDLNVKTWQKQIKEYPISAEPKSPKKEANSANFMKHTSSSTNKIGGEPKKPKSRGSIVLENRIFGV